MPPKVVLLNPSMQTAGYSIITPRWLFVIAEATPKDIVGDPILVDESIEEFDPNILRPGDIVGIGITTGNVVPAYEAVRKAKARGAIVIAGGIHATIFPDEPIEMGADAVVTGNGDVVWSTVVEDAVCGTLRKQYAGGRVPGDGLLKARWNLLDPRHYMFATLQTVAGCPENCSFCSVWVTEGRTPRHRLADKIIEEANELYERGFRFIVFADDNFNPSTLGRIARESSPQKRKELEHIRQERLDFFDEYDRRVPKNLYAFTQMTVEAVSDPEYLAAMHDKMRIRGALVGVESFSEEGLKSANKQWNPTGKKMVETIQKIQDAGICVLSSIICGLETDTVETIRTMRNFALESGTMLAQFPVYHPYPGTKDFYEMVTDIKNLEKPNYTPKHQTRIPEERFWLKRVNPLDRIKHANISRADLLTENQKCWTSFYSIREAWKRVNMGRSGGWPLFGKFTYVMMCLAFRRIYGGQGMAADGVRRKRLGLTTKIIIKVGLGTYNHFYRKELGGRIGKPWAQPAHPSIQPVIQASTASSTAPVETPIAPN
jgi:radical SAM superfamily enzyme YgiQ (UPF0313 family)